MTIADELREFANECDTRYPLDGIYIAKQLRSLADRLDLLVAELTDRVNILCQLNKGEK